MNKDNRKISLKDIAQIENVSIASVSMALAGKSGISPKVAERIKNTAIELGYSPSVRKKNYGNRLGTVAILLPIDAFSMHSWNIFTRIIMQIEQHLIKNNLFTCIIPVNNIISQKNILKKLLEMRVKAVISIHHQKESLFAELSYNDIPVIIINNSVLEDSYTSVLVDDFQGAYYAMLELINNGHKEILYVDYPRTDLPNILMDRRMGVQKASLEYITSGCHIHMQEIPNYDSSSLRKDLEIIEAKQISAILAHDDYLAASLFLVVMEMGYRVPDDISMISTGGGVLDYNIASTPQISAFELDVELIGKIAGEETIRLVESKDKSIRVLRTKQLFRDRFSIKNLIDS